MTKEKFIRVLGKIGNLGSHFLMIAALAVVFSPIAKWYFEKTPLLGTDFFLTKTYVSYLERFFSLRPDGWKYIWSGGYPLARDYPTLHFYLILPLLKFFSQVQAIQIYMLVCTFLFGLFAYLLFYEVSKSRLFSLLLAAACLYSIGLYSSLVWAGGLPYYATQFFLPLVLWFIVRHFGQREEKRGNRKFLVLSGFFVGLAFLTHAQAPLTSILPWAMILILCWHDQKTPLISRVKLIDIIIFLGVIVATGFSFIRLYFATIFNLMFVVATTGQKMTNPVGDVGYNLPWELNQLQKIWTESNQIFGPAMVIAAVFFLVGTLLGRRISKKIWLIFPVVFFFVFMYLSLLAWVYRYNPFQGGWYRAFWSFPLIYGLVASTFWGAGQAVLSEKRWGKIFSGLAGLILFTSLAVYGFGFQENFFDRLGKGANASSAYPPVMNMAVTTTEEAETKQTMVPGWLDTNDKNHRMYSNDVTHNIGWNSYFDLPLFNGYTDPPINFYGRGYLYLADITLTKDELIKRFKNTEEEARNVARFVLDWSAIRYFEGWPSENRITIAPLSTYLKDFVKNEETMKFNSLFYNVYFMPQASVVPAETHYYEFKDELVSPIMEGSNASTIAVIGKFGAIDFLGRTLALENINSKKIVPIIGPEKIDDWQLSDYQKFDAVFLYAYDYKNFGRAWEILKKYVEGGGKIYIDTGGDVKETTSNLLPAIFPVRRTNKGFFGKTWDFETGESELGRNIDFGQFAPAELDNKEWGISYAEPADIDKQTRIILKNKGKVVAAEKEIGKGKVIWTGFNLPYHINYYQKATEREFFLQLLGDLVNLEAKQAPSGDVRWLSPERRQISLSGVRGVLLKEYLFPGWEASVSGDNSGKTGAKIYAAGPAYPGYMYIAIPEKFKSDKIVVEFKFRGQVSDWFWEFLSVFMGLVVFDYVFLNGKIFTSRLAKVHSLLGKRTVSWWEKEEE